MRLAVGTTTNKLKPFRAEPAYSEIVRRKMAAKKQEGHQASSDETGDHHL